MFPRRLFMSRQVAINRSVTSRFDLPIISITQLLPTLNVIPITLGVIVVLSNHPETQ
jgi:hypothetical protein